jgi:glycosyltransferase involved in cell wall biosynthesis
VRPPEPVALTSCAGEPTSPACWSGTTRNLFTALAATGTPVLAYSSLLPPWASHLTRLISLGRGHTFEHRRGTLARRAFHRATSRQLKGSGVRAVLHTGELDLPLRPDGRRHYLFIDSTLDLYLSNPCQPGLAGQRGRREAERATAAGFRQVEHFFPISRYVARNLVETYGIPAGRVTVAGTGAGRIEPFVGHKDFRQGHVLFVAKGRVCEKGGYLLVDAFRYVRDAGCDVPLVIVGATELAPAVRGMPNVELYGHVSDELLKRLFHAATLYAMPALHEPWGLVYLEALASKVPVLGLRRAALPEITCDGSYGFLADTDAPEEVARILLDALADRDRLAAMGEAGQQHCLRTYRWDKTAATLASVVAAPLAEGNGP